MKEPDSAKDKPTVQCRKRAFSKVLLSFLLFTLIAVMLIAFDWQCQRNRKIDEVGVYAQQVLKAKYHQDFVIASSRYVRELKTYEFKLYPKGAPQADFSLWIGGVGAKHFRDTYTLTRISHETWQMVKPYIDAISPQNVIVTVGVGTAGLSRKKATENALYDLHRRQTSLTDWVRNHSSTVGFGIKVYFNSLLTNNFKRKLFEKTYQLVKYLQSIGLTKISVRYQVFDFKDQDIKALYQKWKQSLPQKFKSKYIAGFGITSHRWIYAPDNPRANQRGYIRINDLATVHQPSDLAPFFHQYRQNGDN